MRPRRVTHRYEDPLDRVWCTAAERIGLAVERTEDAYAATDGAGRLRLGAPSTLDPDDCLAQMIFHELCHSLVEGPDSFELPDWGLDNVDLERDLPRERACLRAQAVLAGRVGLRWVFAPTTDHRAFYDALPADPLEGDDPSVPMARRAIERAARDPWGPHLLSALDASAKILAEVRRFAPAGSLLSLAQEPPARHPSGGYLHPDPRDRTCGGCAFHEPSCPVHGERPQLDWPACEDFVAELDCRACAACCREAYQVVELDERDPFVARHAALVERVDGRLVLRRADGRCPPLEGDGPYRCALYEDRPETCREFERGGEHCLTARRRVGLSV